VISSPAIGSDGTVYVGSVDKKLYALNGKSGTLYVESWDKKLYAIKTNSKGPAKSPWPMRGQNPQHTGRAPAK